MTPEEWWESNHNAYQKMLYKVEEDAQGARAEFIETRSLLRTWARNEDREWKSRWRVIRRERVMSSAENMFMGEDAA